jgi:hypothetical protein
VEGFAVKVLTDAGAGLATDIICGIDWGHLDTGPI